MANAAFTTVHSAQLREGINAPVESPCPIVAASYSGNIKATVVAVRMTASKARRVDCLCLAEGVAWSGGDRVCSSWLSVGGSAERALGNKSTDTCVLSVEASSSPLPQVYILVTSKYRIGQGTIGATEGSPIVL